MSDQGQDTQLLSSRSRTTSQNMRGFTLLELMATIAIVSIITMVSVPLYQGYALRARVGGDLLLGDPVKKLVSEEFIINSAWPANNAEAAANEPAAYSGRFLKSVEVTDDPVEGSIVLTYDTDALPALTGKNTIVFYPKPDAQSIIWLCDGGTMKDKYRPSQCRSS